MSHQTPIPVIVNPQPVPQGPETWDEKFKRKFKEQPLVPIGVGLTCAALVVSIVRQRQGRSRDMNKWLWARIAAQGFTIVAIVGGTYALGNTKQQVEARHNRAASPSAEADQRRESEAFGARLQAAEAAHAVESAELQARKEWTARDKVDKVEDAGMVGVASKGPVVQGPSKALGMDSVRRAPPAPKPEEPKSWWKVW